MFGFGKNKKKETWNTIRMYVSIMFNPMYQEYVLRAYRFDENGLGERRFGQIDIPRGIIGYTEETRRLETLGSMWANGVSLDFFMLDNKFMRISDLKEANELLVSILVNSDEINVPTASVGEVAVYYPVL